MEDQDYHIDILCQANAAEARTEPLRQAIQATLHKHHRPSCRLSVAVVDEAHMARLHQEHLGKPGPTDCLSFDLRDDIQSKDVEGEIVVSWDAARREARARRIDAQAELALYVVHGLLHLLGYDDRTPEQAARMHRTEDDILNSIGLGPVYGVPPK